MSNPTSNFGWVMPTSSDLVTDLPADFAVFGQGVDTTLAELKGGTTGQILSKTSNTDMDFTWIANDVGDITSVGVTSPITGGGTSGAVTIAIQDASTSQKGAVQLSDSTSTTSSILAATSTAVKAAYDLANSVTRSTSQLTTLPNRVAAGEQLLSQAVWWIDCAQTDSSDQVLDNQGWGGTTLTTQLGSTTSADSNDPKFLSWSGTNYLYLPGVAYNYASTPDSAALDITGDIDIRVKAAMDDWTPASINMLLSKYSSTAGGLRSYQLMLSTSGYLNLQWSTDGSTLTNNIPSTAIVSFADGATGWVRATLDVDNGASGNTVTFYTSTDGTTWTQLGTAVTTSGVTSIFSGGAQLEVGTRNVGSAEASSGKFFRAQVFNGIAGTMVFDADFDNIVTGADTSFYANTGQLVTINRSTTGKKAVAVVYPTWLFGTDDYMEVADNSLIDFGATDSFTLFAVGRQWSTFGTNDVILAKKDSTTATAAGYLLGDDGTTAALGRMQAGDGTNGTSATSGSSRASGTLYTITGVRSVASDNLTVYLNATAGSVVADTTTLTLANAEVLRVGRLSGAGTEYNDMELSAAAIFNRALTATEITTLYNYYLERIGG